MNKKEEMIKRSLELQKEIFGDILFEKVSVTNPSLRRTEVVKDEVILTSMINKKEVGPPVIITKKEVISASVISNKELIPVSVINKILAPDKSDDYPLASSLSELNETICNCLKCSLGATRNKFVFGSGNINADVLVVGEGPGKDEDEQGLPFVGRAGKLLTDILAAIKFSREEVYIANIVKCRPPGNRTPLPAEMEACMPYLKKQIALIRPKLILCLGLTAAQGLLKKRDTLGNFRGKVFDFEDTKLMVTYHPAALLRNPAWKKDCWADVQAFRKLYEETVL